MLYIGLDFHTMMSAICALDGNGKVVRTQSIYGPMDIVCRELAGIKEEFKICFEASTGYGTLHDRLRTIAAEVVVAHPGKIRLIFNCKRKTDRIDARKLATLLYLQQVPRVHVPVADVRAWRTMINHRGGLIDQRTGAKSSLRAFLRHRGIPAPRKLWNKVGRAWLQGLVFAQSLDTVQRDSLLVRLAMLEDLIRRVETELLKIADRHPGVQILMTIPGVGIRTAEAVMAYIDIPGRFPRTRAIGDYFGMVPCLDQSADKRKVGHITKDGPAVVRRVITEAAWQAIKRSQAIKARFLRYLHGDKARRKIAIVAVGHYLLRVMCAMLKHNSAWNPALA